MKAFILTSVLGSIPVPVIAKLPAPGCPMPLFLYRGNYDEVTDDERKLMDNMQEGCVRYYGKTACLTTVEKLGENNYKVMCIKKENIKK